LYKKIKEREHNDGIMTLREKMVKKYESDTESSDNEQYNDAIRTDEESSDNTSNLNDTIHTDEESSDNEQYNDTIHTDEESSDNEQYNDAIHTDEETSDNTIDLIDKSNIPNSCIINSIVNKNCIAILKSGTNKGKLCGIITKTGNYCKRHNV